MDKSVRSTSITVVITVVTALLTSLLAPYAIESLKEQQAQRNRESEKQDRIIATQFEIIEKCNTAYWNYQQAADFLILDFANDQPDGPLADKHRAAFHEASVEASSQLRIQAFRARMYFGSEGVYRQLMEIPDRIFLGGIDSHIEARLHADEVPLHLSKSQKQQWEDLHKELSEVETFVQADLNSAFLQIGSHIFR
jgi:hypothetical protein